MPTKREATAAELRNLTDDLRSLLATVAHDPAEQAKRERRWKLLYGGLSALSALLARRLATKSWGILTGEQPPTKRKAKA